MASLTHTLPQVVAERQRELAQLIQSLAPSRHRLTVPPDSPTHEPRAQPAQPASNDCRTNATDLRLSLGNSQLSRFKRSNPDDTASLKCTFQSTNDGNFPRHLLALDVPEAEATKEQLMDFFGKIVRLFKFRVQDPFIRKYRNCLAFITAADSYQIVAFFSGKVFIGKMIQTRKTGWGIEWSRSTLYTGDWANNLRHGQGTELLVEESVRYQGSWANNLKSGFGQLVGPLSRYKGQFREGNKHGHGEQYFKDGRKYIGDFKFGVFDGVGQLFSSEGQRLVGVFQKGQFKQKAVSGQKLVLKPNLACEDGRLKFGSIRVHNRARDSGLDWSLDHRDQEYVMPEPPSQLSGRVRHQLQVRKGRLKSEHQVAYKGECQSEMRYGRRNEPAKRLKVPRKYSAVARPPARVSRLVTHQPYQNPTFQDSKSIRKLNGRMF